MTYSAVHDYEKAAHFTRLEIEAAKKVLDPIPISGSTQQRFGALVQREAMSLRHTRLGTLLRILHLNAGTKVQRIEEELETYNAAIAYSQYPAAYAARAEVHAIMCKPAEAQRDIEEAVQLVRRSGLQQKVKEYSSTLLPSCDSYWRTK